MQNTTCIIPVQGTTHLYESASVYMSVHLWFSCYVHGSVYAVFFFFPPLAVAQV